MTEGHEWKEKNSLQIDGFQWESEVQSFTGKPVWQMK